MANYVCIIFGKSRGALTFESFECDDERLAVAQALALAQSIRDAFGYELWDGGHKVSNYFAHEPLALALPKSETSPPGT